MLAYLMARMLAAGLYGEGMQVASKGGDGEVGNPAGRRVGGTVNYSCVSVMLCCSSGYD